MSDLQKYKKKRAEQDPKFWSGYDDRLETFKLGIMLKQARLESGLTQEQIAKSLKTTKSVISRIENHATDIRLSTLEKFAKALGRKIHVSLL
ncbi:MAG: helix-turn-helix transcriptional regulator [Desulfobacteraceae bacterium]|jgi:ribosome-binding protein aMBF1 (putative translation factor)|nr:helix-turn-helix transcriptional regulator [Desulfobacteraceae bacterium]MBC2757421.1 helix-turn-helix transcriptional regulator [Desulfobacteraceae bacterium]MBC2763825.1 helix-turn-helix transcriptional regulator [ANME-2 cluster archaeon]